MNEVSRLISNQRETERRFAADAAHDQSPRGWSAALTFFHIARWRQRLLEAMTAHAAARSYAALAGDIDEFNDAELPAGADVSLAIAAAQSDATLGSLIELWEKLGDQPFKWFMAESTSEALMRNSYLHPRIHMATYLVERGDQERGDQMVEETATELRAANAPAPVLGAALYNLASVRLSQGKHDEALDLLEEAALMRPDLQASAMKDAAFGVLRDLPRFRSIAK
jgi:tetratricopeptide (TPR) repeat protein